MFWMKSGTVQDCCEKVSKVERISAGITICPGTVPGSHAACKEHLTRQVSSELAQYGFDDQPVSTELTSEPSGLFRIQRSVSSPWPRLECGTGQVLLAIDDCGDDPGGHEVRIQRGSVSRCRPGDGVLGQCRASMAWPSIHDADARATILARRCDNEGGERPFGRRVCCQTNDGCLRDNAAQSYHEGLSTVTCRGREIGMALGNELDRTGGVHRK